MPSPSGGVRQLLSVYSPKMASAPSLGILGNVGWGRRSGKRAVAIPEDAPDPGDVREGKHRTSVWVLLPPPCPSFDVEQGILLTLLPSKPGAAEQPRHSPTSWKSWEINVLMLVQSNQKGWKSWEINVLVLVRSKQKGRFVFSCWMCLFPPPG